MRVHILATCRNLELRRATTCVFRTLRIGFPNAEVVVHGNDLRGEALDWVSMVSQLTGCSFSNLPHQRHADWVEKVIARTEQPFYIADTDMDFNGNVEIYRWNTAIAGMQMPKFHERYTDTISMPRLHTCLLYVNPEKVRDELHKSSLCVEGDPFEIPMVNMVQPFFHVDHQGRRVFYDTAAMLSYHVSKTEFPPNVIEKFTHYNAGTYIDIVGKHYPELEEANRRMRADH